MANNLECNTSSSTSFNCPCLILSIAGSIQAYEQFVIMTRGGPSNSTKTLVMHTVDMGLIISN